MLPLPPSVASKSMDEDESGLPVAAVVGDVEMDRGLSVEIDRAGAEAAEEVVDGEAAVQQKCEAEEPFQQRKEPRDKWKAAEM